MRCWIAVALIVGLASGASGADVRSAGATQLIMAITPSWDATQGELRRFEWRDERWQPIGAATPVSIGRAGSAWGMGLHEPQAGRQKQEGDGRSPAGVFAIGSAFGYAQAAQSGLPYRSMTQFDYCIDVNESPLYNRIVDARDVGQAAVAKSTEPMRRDIHANGDRRYRLGFVIEHNPGNEATRGSCIFAHLWGSTGQTTAGCTAMAEEQMQQLVSWLDAKARPVFVLLPVAEYERLRVRWRLPDVGATQ